MDDHSKSQVKRLVAQSPEYAAGYQAGREAGMREAAEVERLSLIRAEDYSRAVKWVQKHRAE